MRVIGTITDRLERWTALQVRVALLGTFLLIAVR
jgi:hypothetical protein